MFQVTCEVRENAPSPKKTEKRTGDGRIHGEADINDGGN